MRYVISGNRLMARHFVITDESGPPRFTVDGSLGPTRRLTLRDDSGRELAEISKHPMSTRHDILIDGQRVAGVRHEGLFGARYQIDSSAGGLAAKGNFTGWEYSISDGGQPIATVSRQRALKETFIVDVADDADQVFVLALVLAIGTIQDQRR